MSTAQINVYPSYETEIACKVITAEQINASTIMGIAIKTETELPIANAGIDQTIHSGTQVIMDGSGSTDPDGNYPLTYAWEIVSKPEGSAAILSDPAIVNPTFTADLPGDYSMQLIVTDNLGASSAPATVMVSTLNTPPVADAGEDQAITTTGSVVQLDGSGSWDDDGDPLTYSWSINSKPDGSSTALSDPVSENPTFVPDVYGDYLFELVVTDPWVSSSPDTVKISFNNIKPVADAGGNQSTVVDDTVYMDGSNSYDANNDPITYTWTIVSKPEGSTADLTAAEAVQTSLTPDVPGSYVVSLIVNDGNLNSDPDNITVTAISIPDGTTDLLQECIVTINTIDPMFFKNKNMPNTLTNKINAVLEKIDQGLYEEALNQLKNDVLKKTNGCAEIGEPDKNDWIEDCVTQEQVYPFILEAIEKLENLIQ